MSEEKTPYWKPSHRRDGVCFERINYHSAAYRFWLGKPIILANELDLGVIGVDYDGRKLNGRGLCWWCRAELPKYRRTWCSDDCAVLYGWSTVLSAVFKRDKGICCKCGTDTEAVREAWQRIYLRNYKIAIEVMRELGWPSSPSRAWWEADHIVSRDDDGEDHPRNLRTLCVRCHKARSAEQSRERSIRRRALRHRTNAESPALF